MSGCEVDEFIISNTPWLKLPKNIKQLLGSSQKEYEKLVLEYSVKNQLRYKGNLVRHMRKNEEDYYSIVMQHSRTNLMLFPYHLSDIVIKEMRITPFQYYINMMTDLMNAERSYDSLPNFTAADCLRLLGIGRNQYIDLMNQCRSSKRLAFRKKPVREILPACPVQISLEPWWIAQVGNVIEDDIKLCTRKEKDIIDMLIDEGGMLSCSLDMNILQKLYLKGLLYFEVPVNDSDTIVVPTLDGFVMNRVTGDYFEKLLYKIFVSNSENTTVSELANNILNIDLSLVKNAISMFCRLGFAQKKVTGVENMARHRSWPHPNLSLDTSSVTSEDIYAFGEIDPTTPGSDEDTPSMPGELLAESTIDIGALEGSRIGFLFDSTLTAFLMMGNLSPSLKSHAVTLFEAGKLSEEALDSLSMELKKVQSFGEGEAQQYFDHAQVLGVTIEALRNDKVELDLLRCESLMELDRQSRLRVLRKSYRLLISMAPLSNEVEPINCCSPAHLGPPVSEVNSPWFRLFLYETLGCGPVSLLIAKGERIGRIPKPLRKFDKLLLCTWTHEPGLLSTHTCLPALNESLQHSAVFLQAYSDYGEDAQIVHVPFPPSKNEASRTPFDNHPDVIKLIDAMGLDYSCGYVTLVNTCNKHMNSSKGFSWNRRGTDSRSSMSIDPRRIVSQVEPTQMNNANEWTLFDCVFGVPLFHRQLNNTILNRIRENRLIYSERIDEIQETNRNLSLKLLDFIQRFQPVLEESGGEHQVPYPVHSLLFCDGTVSVSNYL